MREGAGAEAADGVSATWTHSMMAEGWRDPQFRAVLAIDELEGGLAESPRLSRS